MVYKSLTCLTCFSFEAQRTTGVTIKVNRRALSYSGLLCPPVSREMLKDGPIIQLPAIAYFYLPLPTNYQLLPAWN